jgi:hypothetical protein
MKSTLRSISFAVLALALLPSILSAQVPSPQQFFGFKIGDDNKLARYDHAWQTVHPGRSLFA